MTGPVEPSHQPDSPLFNRLPLEVRENIYALAFGHETRKFYHNGLCVATSVKGCYVHCDKEQGLPEWLLTCRLMLSEAMHFFHCTRAFSPLHRWRTITPANSTPNKLVFQENTIRLVEFQYPYLYSGSTDIYHWDHERHHRDASPRYFLARMEPFLAENLRATLDWGIPHAHLNRAGQYLRVEPALFEPWGRKWAGRFWQITIRLRLCTDHGHDEVDVEAFREAAERCGRKLVGGGGEDGGKVSKYWRSLEEGEEEVSSKSWCVWASADLTMLQELMVTCKD